MRHRNAAGGPFAVIFGPPAFRLAPFFLVPLAIVRASGVGRPAGLTQGSITGPRDNDRRHDGRGFGTGDARCPGWNPRSPVALLS